MIETLLFVGTGSLLVFGSVSLAVAALALRNARRYVELAEKRMEHLREGQDRLLKFLNEHHRVPMEEPEQQARLAEELERERRAHREAERRIDHLQRELQKLGEAQRERSLPVSAGLSEGRTEVRRPTQKPRGAEKAPASFPETSARKPKEGSRQDTGQRVGVWHPHPDDARSTSGQAQGRRGASIEMFRKHYDKYLENYEGYVEIVEGLYRMRDEGGAPPGSPAEREWKERLRRVNDGIERTAARLDVLEGCNPGLAADERVSRRASVARRYSKIENAGRGH